MGDEMDRSSVNEDALLARIKRAEVAISSVRALTDPTKHPWYVGRMTDDWTCPRKYAHKPHPYWQHGEDHYCGGTLGYAAAEQLARRFHEAYERLAPIVGYHTSITWAKPWGQVPEGNRRLMIATCAEILFAQPGAEPPAEQWETYADALAAEYEDHDRPPFAGWLALSRNKLRAAIQQIRTLAEQWRAMDPYGEISFNDAADAVLAAVEPAPTGPIIGYKVGDKLYAPEDVTIVRQAVPLPERSDEEFAVGDWVLVDVGDVVQQRGQVVNVVPAAGGGVWEYDVRVRDGEVISSQPKRVYPDYTRSDSGLPVDGETT